MSSALGTRRRRIEVLSPLLYRNRSFTDFFFFILSIPQAVCWRRKALRSPSTIQFSSVEYARARLCREKRIDGRRFEGKQYAEKKLLSLSVQFLIGLYKSECVIAARRWNRKEREYR